MKKKTPPTTLEVIQGLKSLAPTNDIKKEAERLILLAESFLGGGTGENYIVEMNVTEYVCYLEIKEIINHIKSLKQCKTTD